MDFPSQFVSGNDTSNSFQYLVLSCSIENIPRKHENMKNIVAVIETRQQYSSALHNVVGTIDGTHVKIKTSVAKWTRLL